MKKLYSLIFSILVLAAVIYVSRDQIIKIAEIKDFSLTSLVLISLFFILTQLTFGLQLKVILGVFNITSSFKEWFGLIAVQSLGNYLPLSGGTISNIAYLKINKKLPVSDYLGFFMGTTVLKITIYGTLGVLILFVQGAFFKQTHFILTLVTSVLFLLGLILLFLPGSKSKSTNKVITWIVQMHDGWLKIRHNPKVLLTSIFTVFITLTFISSQYYFIFKELEFNFNIWSIYLLTIITNIVRVASIFPGNIGLRESVSGIVLQLLGYPFGYGVIVSLVGRIISLIWIVLFGGIFSYLLINSNNKRDNILNDKKN